MIKLELKAFSQGFFDRKAVTSKVDVATRRVLSKFGAFVRTRARRSIRNRKRVSRPGEAPTSQTGVLRRFIFFAFDATRESVVIGPVRVSGVAERGIPERLEYGGTIRGDGREMVITGDVGRDDRGRFTSGGRRVVMLRGRLDYKARPYMGPALEAERPGLPDLWRNSVR